MTQKEIWERQLELEKQGKFDQHVTPINYDIALPVDENFNYLNKGFWRKIKYFFLNNIIVKPFTCHINRKVTKTIVKGRQNLKGIDSAIVTCNHVYMFDCLVIKHSLRHKTFVTAGSFNNQKGFLGEMMRVGGMMPFGEGLKAMKNFNNAVKTRLEQKSYIVFYPEQAMWWHYSKPRPNKNGAFHYAVKHNVPVIPTFITYIDTKKVDDEGLPIYQFVYNILPPIYAKKELSPKENIEYLKQANYDAWVKTYEEFYNKKLVYEKE